MRVLLSILTWGVVVLAGCSSDRIYRSDIRQGNAISDEIVAQVKPGMTKDQVSFLMGYPLLVDPFHKQRWDYVYAFFNGKTKTTEERRVTVMFDAAWRVQQVDVLPTRTVEGRLLP